jgi:chloride channel protein, CIC family
VLVVIGAAGSFAALSFIFTSPLIAAVIMIEAAGIGGPRLRLVLLPGLFAAGIGTLVSIGMGSFTGLSTSAYALGRLQVPHFGHPDIAQFGVVVAYVATLALSAVAPARSDAPEPAAATPMRAPDVPAAAPAPGGGGAV